MRISKQSLGRVHFVGIGGIGMSGIAEILHKQGYSIQGSDTANNANVKRLKKLGILVCNSHDASNIDNVSLLVISSAISADNVELQEARKRKIPVIKRAEMLAEIMRLKPSIAVAGTHGKTTTTSIGAAILDAGGMGPTVISGGIINAYGTNAKLGYGQWVLVEADESDGSFAKLPATIAVVTNIDSEHIEHYGSYDNLQNAFKMYLQNIPFYGLAIMCADNEVTLQIAQGITDRRVITYGISDKADLQIVDHRNINGGVSFNLRLSKYALSVLNLEHTSKVLNDCYLPMVGIHNVLNATSMIACALELGVGFDLIKNGLARFSGVKRRFTSIGQVAGVQFIDDYAHHPKEIMATLQAARQVCNGKVMVIMQPHRFSRLSQLFDEFVNCFEDADSVIVAPVYAAGEKNDNNVTHDTLAYSVGQISDKQAIAVDNKDELLNMLQKMIQDGDLSKNDMCIFMGAGDIGQWCREIYDSL